MTKHRTPRTAVPSNRLWSTSAYSRALRIGDRIEVAGTSASDAEGKALYPGDMLAQANHIFEVIQKALEELGGSLDDVVRTQVFTTDITRWREIGAAHYAAFGHLSEPPVSAFYGITELINPDLLIEIEATAIL